MPPVVAAAAIAGGTQVVSSVVGSRAQSGANKRALQASEDAARRAEAFQREQAAREDADDARLEAEDRRRWDTEQANLARQQAERDARQQYEDRLRYRKMVNLARLTGMPAPDPMPTFGGASADPAMATPVRQSSAPLMSRPSTANAMIPQDFDPFAAPAQRMPISRLSRRV
jgi:hypothetical protein